MSFITTEDKLQVWKYIISELTLIYPTTSYDLPIDRLTELSILSDYNNNLFPVIRVNMTIEPSVYTEMMKHKNDLKLKIRLQKYHTTTATVEPSMYRDVFNTTFSLLLDDEFINPDAGIVATKDDISQTAQPKTDELNYTQNNKTEFYLYKTEILQALRKTSNAVLTNVNMLGCISYLCASNNLTNLLVSPLENNNSYPELPIPPMSTLKCIQYLDTQYGFYKSGSMIFFGHDRSYILNYKGGCTAWEKDEVKETCFLIPDRGSNFGSVEGSLEKAGQKGIKNYIIIKSTNLTPTNKSISNNILEGNAVTLVNTNTNTVTTASASTIQKGSTNTNVISTNSANIWLAETYAAQKSTDSVIIDMSCGNFDISAISPNKKFTIIFENTTNGEQYKGTYVMAKANLTLTKSGSELTCSAQMTLKRVGTGVTQEST